ncbi:hypothetical protein RMATCC62417_08557 [Rhizopus microsporus]|nr:hypothetical protein RMATCC62417_08557 [Rhizopus microsporus]
MSRGSARSISLIVGAFSGACSASQVEDGEIPTMEASNGIDGFVVKVATYFANDFAKAKNNSEASFLIKYLWPIINIMFVEGAKKSAIYSL